MISGVLQVIMLFMRASLAVVLVAAGAAKLADTRSFAVTLMGLGVPVRRQLFLRGFAIIVPLTELALGLAIISGQRCCVCTDVRLQSGGYHRSAQKT